MRKYSRLITTEERKNKRTALILFSASIFLILILAFFGIQVFGKISSFLIDLKQKNTSSKDTSKDTISPPPPRILLTTSATNSAKFAVTGFAEPSTKVKIFDNEKETGETDTKDDGTFQMELTLQEGDNILKAKAFDQSGNESSPSFAVKILFDKTPPNLKIEYPQSGQTFFGEKNRIITIKGSSEDGAEVRINERLAIIDPQGNFSYQATLSNGENKFTVTAKDPAGNQTSSELIVSFLP